MIIKNISIPIYYTNCYIIKNNNECIIIDAGGKTEILDYLINNNLTPKAIFLTHGHYDHISAIKNIKKAFTNIKVFAYYKEKEIIENTNNNLSSPMFYDPYTYNDINYLKDNDIINILGYDIKLIATPGHTIGSCCYYIENEKVLFSGDTLFYETYGRYDFPTGSLKNLIDSIINKLMILPNDVKIYPGHNENTTIEHEKLNNEIMNLKSYN